MREDEVCRMHKYNRHPGLTRPSALRCKRMATVGDIPQGLVGVLLRQYADLVRAEFGTRARHLMLFGSYARRTARPDSDVDVAVVVDGLTREERIRCGELAADVCLIHGVCLTPLAFAADELDRLVSLEARIAHDILSEGVAL